MHVSLVMPTLNAGDLLEEVLAGVDQQPDAANLERVAIDSGSTDGTVERLRNHGFEVHGIDKSEFNHGSTRDLGISKTSGEVIVLLTQDAVPADGHWLNTLVSTYDNPQVGAAYCRQIPRDNCNPLIKKRILEWTAGRADPIEQRLEGDPATAFEALEPMQRLRTCAYDNVAGSVRRATWKEIPFGYRRFGEDVAFGKRLILSGQSIMYEPRSAVVHSHNRSPKDEGKRIFCDHANLRELFDIHVLPTWQHYQDAVRHSREEFRGVVDELDLPSNEKLELQQWAEQYAKWSALGIYLGGNSERLSRGFTGVFFGILERHLRKGI
ncbi:MAG: glycosyltransferase [Planctomycetota bacterium]|nr:glycosyltransferase [Planctomycetota bacterium]